MDFIIWLTDMLKRYPTIYKSDAIDPKDFDHNLLELARRVGQNQFSSEEQNFLTRGKKTRKLCRYPASLDTSKNINAKTSLSALRQTMSSARNITYNHSFAKAVDLSEGFLSGDEKTRSTLQSVKNLITADVKTLTSILEKTNRNSSAPLPVLSVVSVVNFY